MHNEVEELNAALKKAKPFLRGTYFYLEDRDLTLLSMIVGQFIEDPLLTLDNVGDIDTQDKEAIHQLTDRAIELQMGFRREGREKKVNTY